jgi:hypothetical protein
MNTKIDRIKADKRVFIRYIRLGFNKIILYKGRKRSKGIYKRGDDQKPFTL